MANDDDWGDEVPEETWQAVDAIVHRFEQAWQTGIRPAIRDFLPTEGCLRFRRLVLEALVKVDIERRQQAGEHATREDYRERYPDLPAESSSVPGPTKYNPGDQQKPSNGALNPLPQQIGRYRVVKVLGKGGFGVVYLAHDDQLSRPVAIKVPHRELVARPEIASLYLTEARAVAGLDHPHIVPVFDVGCTEEFPFFCVSKYIDGCTLAKRIQVNRPSFTQTKDLVATVAEALHYAHRQGLVHRDIKPGNIMTDTSSKPFVVDFGLALKEENVGHGPRYGGTLPYMSPEQVRGEGHRVDGRSDVFSLGVVLYELLTARRPFAAASKEELAEQIANFEPRPPRQIDDTVPKELERICLKALSKRACERYTTAKDMADDLRQCPAHATNEGRGVPRAGVLPAGASGASEPSSPVPPGAEPIKVLPKGLRSFDEHDADFFLALLPGPRDRDGLPECIHFWKSAIEERDADKTFMAGLIYGPSGCGKSSLVKAGLLPRLSSDVIAVYLEATASDTERRLRGGLRKRCPALPVNRNLKGTLAALRHGQGVAAGKKVLIVLDQFEQWLHANREEQSAELVGALRQCDGGRVQCIVMVRDDFWMAATRFMRQLEIPLLEGQNSGAVDLFDVDHARKVLEAFGRAFGKLPEDPNQTSREQKQFLSRAILGLAQEGKVVCVRLAVFAEMMKGKPWTLASLRAVGGTVGLGATFLEETFSAATAPPEHRYHQKAARAVLKALLPEAGTDLKVHMRSYQELLEASGYGRYQGKLGTKDFDDLLRILNRELRLITPTEPAQEQGGGGSAEGRGTQEESSASPANGQPSSLQYYQLTHDYLVHSLRDWLKRTPGGRAEHLLTDLAGIWNARPRNRHLPSLYHWAYIRLLTKKKNWTQPQRRMMQKAGRFYALRALMLSTILALVSWGGYEQYGALKARALCDQLLKADTQNVLSIVDNMARYRRSIDPLLRDAYREAQAGKDAASRMRLLHASIALLPVDGSQKEYLYARLLDATPQETHVLCHVLAVHQRDLVDRLWAVAEQPAEGKETQRLRAACALAKYDPDSEGWAEVAEPIVDDFVSVPPVHLDRWMDCLRPVAGRLQASLEAVFRDTQRAETERNLAANILADYAADQPQVLADLLMDADEVQLLTDAQERQFAAVYPKLEAHRETALVLLEREINTPLASVVGRTAKEAKEIERANERLAKRQANAAVALLRMGRPAIVWPLLEHRKDPRVRTYLIHRLGPLGADPSMLAKRLDEGPDVTIRRALVLSFGEFRKQGWPHYEWELFVTKLKDLYQKVSDPGLRSAAEWLLRHWNQDQWLKQVDADWAKNKEQRENRLKDIQAQLAKDTGQPKPQWYVNGQGQNMVVIPSPVPFKMGSPPTEEDRQGKEAQHRRRIGRTFALAAKPVTFAEYRRFKPKHEPKDPRSDHPVVLLSWFKAAEYCNWLNKVEGIPPDQWCYLPNKAGEYADGMKMAPDYLQLTGYRLPTEAEMEFASRAGAETSRYFGESPLLLRKYAWYALNYGGLVWPVGRLKPNDFGLFDVHGNVWCWCQDKYDGDYPQRNDREVVEDKEDYREIRGRDPRVVRGNCCTDVASFMRCASRWSPATSQQRFYFVGFRIARTIRAE
jgi:formylglycine-generating enzyme required for sulfatase activity